MKQNQKNQTTNKVVENSPICYEQDGCAHHSEQAHVTQDLKHSVLIVSVLTNAFVFISWLVLQTTSEFNAAVASAIFR